MLFALTSKQPYSRACLRSLVSVGKWSCSLEFIELAIKISLKCLFAPSNLVWISFLKQCQWLQTALLDNTISAPCPHPHPSYYPPTPLSSSSGRNKFLFSHTQAFSHLSFSVSSEKLKLHSSSYPPPHDSEDRNSSSSSSPLLERFSTGWISSYLALKQKIGDTETWVSSVLSLCC